MKLFIKQLENDDQDLWNAAFTNLQAELVKATVLTGANAEDNAEAAASALATISGLQLELSAVTAAAATAAATAASAASQAVEAADAAAAAAAAAALRAAEVAAIAVSTAQCESRALRVRLGEIVALHERVFVDARRSATAATALAAANAATAAAHAAAAAAATHALATAAEDILGYKDHIRQLYMRLDDEHNTSLNKQAAAEASTIAAANTADEVNANASIRIAFLQQRLSDSEADVLKMKLQLVKMKGQGSQADTLRITSFDTELIQANRSGHAADATIVLQLQVRRQGFKLVHKPTPTSIYICPYMHCTNIHVLMRYDTRRFSDLHLCTSPFNFLDSLCVWIILMHL